MKQILAVLLSVWFVSSGVSQEVIRPRVAKAFGDVVIVKGCFVSKPNSYYAQNIISEKYLFRVDEVGGIRLKSPVVIEYKFEGEDHEWSRIERVEAPASLEAYETVYQPMSSTPWLKEGEQGEAYVLINCLHLRVLPKEANKSVEPTPTAVTPAASAPGAPSAGVSHH